MLRELAGRETPERYRLRSSGRYVYIRHNTGDRVVLHELFYEGHYDLPETVAAYLDGLGRPPEIVDLGANIGLFGVQMFARFPIARITAFEPDHTNAEVHRRTMAENHSGGHWQVVEAAASNRDGQVYFRSGEFARSRIEPGDGPEQVDAVNVFPHLERADFAKIDIEGGEWAILGDDRFGELRTPCSCSSITLTLSEARSESRRAGPPQPCGYRSRDVGLSRPGDAVVVEAGARDRRRGLTMALPEVRWLSERRDGVLSAWHNVPMLQPLLQLVSRSSAAA